MTAGSEKDNGKAAGIMPRSVASEHHLAAMNAGRMFLSRTNTPITQDEMRFVYQNVYPRAQLTEADQKLQRRQVMAAEAVSAELGLDMQSSYEWLVENAGFQNAGDRPHNTYTDLPRHLWDTAYRAQLMGLKLPDRQLALMHSLPEYKARGLTEARRFISAVKTEFGEDIASGLELLADWGGILVDHLRYRVEQIGDSGRLKSESSSLEYLKRRLEAISRKEEKTQVEATLERVLRLHGAKDRLVPLELADNLIYPEAKARLHRAHVDSLATAAIAQTKKQGQTQSYATTSLVVKGLCLIDRLRTADGAAQTEKVTRETADFLPRLDAAVSYLHGKKSVNNPLEFVTAALKTEFLMELEQRTAQARSMRDTRFRTVADLLEERLVEATRLYGGVAKAMGYATAYESQRLRPDNLGLRLSSP